jgi:hypothetical protein
VSLPELGRSRVGTYFLNNQPSDSGILSFGTAELWNLVFESGTWFLRMIFADDLVTFGFYFQMKFKII